MSNKKVFGLSSHGKLTLLGNPVLKIEENDVKEKLNESRNIDFGPNEEDDNFFMPC